MNATLKLVLIVTVPMPQDKNLTEALARAQSLKESDAIMFKRGVEYSDGTITVVGVSTGEWTD